MAWSMADRQGDPHAHRPDGTGGEALENQWSSAAVRH